jgi:hypothetical protein
MDCVTVLENQHMLCVCSCFYISFSKLYMPLASLEASLSLDFHIKKLYFMVIFKAGITEIAECLIGALKTHLTRVTCANFADNAEDEYGLAGWLPNHRRADKFTPYTGYYCTGNGDIVFSSRGEE